MKKRTSNPPIKILSLILSLTLAGAALLAIPVQNVRADSSTDSLLTDPFLQVPTDTSCNVVWFTAFPGTVNEVLYGNNLEKAVAANTTKMSRMRVDTASGPATRDVWRHEADVAGLPANTDGKQEIPYKVISDSAESNVYTLSSKPAAGAPMKILLTSDSQLHNMVAADMQKVKETVGNVNAVFFSGDCVNVADDAKQWFDDPSGMSFFPVMQGTASKSLNGVTYKGADIIQNAPIYTAIGNHEVMGKYSTTASLNTQFNTPAPVSYAESLYDQEKATVNPTNDPQIKAQFIQDNSFNTTTYNEVFDLPKNDKGNQDYYATTIGDVRLVTLDVARIWRNNQVGQMSKYSESTSALNDMSQWGFGSFIFEPIKKGSDQYNWLQNELQSAAFKSAKYKVVMFHFPPHELGDNMVPAFTDPVQKTIKDASGKVTQILYDYPLQDDYLKNDLEPLLENAGVDLVFYGHSHLWNRFQSAGGMNYLESSNVGNTYGAYYNDGNSVTMNGSTNGSNVLSSTSDISGMIPSNTARSDTLPSDMTNFDPSNYVKFGDPNGLLPIMPNLQSLNNLPYLASNTTTEFSILDTGTGKIDSYYYDTANPNSKVVKFDSFSFATNNISTANTSANGSSGTGSTVNSKSSAQPAGSSASSLVSNPKTGSHSEVPVIMLVFMAVSAAMFLAVKFIAKKRSKI